MADIRTEIPRTKEIVSQLQEDRLNPLMQVSQKISSHSDLDLLLEQILETALRLLKAKRGSLMLIDPSTQTLRIKVSKGIDPQVARKITLKVGEGVAGTVAKEGKPILVEDIETYKRFHKTPVSKYESRSFVSVPILSAPLNVFGSTLGVMNVSDSQRGSSFTTEDLALLTILAVEASVLVAYSQLLEKVQGVEENHLSKIGQLATGMAHGIHNPLTVISGHAQYLLLHIPQECKSAEILKKIVHQTERAAQMIKSLLHFSKLPIETQAQKMDEVLEEIRRDSRG